MNSFTKELRQNMSNAEKALWFQLRGRRFFGYKFRRQHSVEQYIVDFYCAEKKLIIEIDGGQHNWQNEKDQERTALLKFLGYKVIRFWNNEILQNAEGVLLIIKEHLK